MHQINVYLSLYKFTYVIKIIFYFFYIKKKEKQNSSYKKFERNRFRKLKTIKNYIIIIGKSLR